MKISPILLTAALLGTLVARAQQPAQTQRTKTDQKRTDTSPTSQSSKKLNPTDAKASTDPASGTLSTGSKNPPPGSSIGWDTRQSGNKNAGNTAPTSGMNGRSSDESKAQTSRNTKQPGRTDKGPTGASISSDPKRNDRSRAVTSDPSQQTSTDGKSPDVKVDPARTRRASGRTASKSGGQ